MARGDNLKGRPPGATNRAGRSVKETFEQVFKMLQDGRVASLEQWADANPTEFYRLCNKLIPAAIEQKTEHSGPDGGAIPHSFTVRVVTGE